MELKNYFAILRRWGWIMLLCTALAGVTGYLYISRQLPVYQSRARYLIGPGVLKGAWKIRRARYSRPT